MALAISKLELHLKAGVALRAKGLAAPTGKAKFTDWLQNNEAAQSFLLQHHPELADELGLEQEIDPRMADLIVRCEGEQATPELGRRVLDLNLTSEALQRQLRAYPAAQALLTAAIASWKDQITGQQEASARRLADLEAANAADQARWQSAGNPVALGFAEARAAERKRRIREMEAEFDRDEARAEAAARFQLKVRQRASA